MLSQVSPMWLCHLAIIQNSYYAISGFGITMFKCREYNIKTYDFVRTCFTLTSLAYINTFLKKFYLRSKVALTQKTMSQLRDISFGAMKKHREWFQKQEQMVADEFKTIGKNSLRRPFGGIFQKN
ncbi:hypothetical protein LSTR_LSTR013310 [Laodelphax striatellus]|uniref:Uncharacterized protein n=1 Tax=Laodelphax striatellus TaxID=195883 RepID=A0A482WF20_LAOST|nr:hypothetical protein LSTR_LSTR013310 [Laodelphax striatellus]